MHITRETAQGRQLLVFTHRVPDAPDVQVPGGTIEPGESPVEGALREAREETGLSTFGPPCVLAEEVWHGPDEVVRCSFVHLPLAQAAPDAWEHVVSARELDQGLVFAFSWATLPRTNGSGPPW